MAFGENPAAHKGMGTTLLALCLSRFRKTDADAVTGSLRVQQITPADCCSRDGPPCDGDQIRPFAGGNTCPHTEIRPAIW